uniref:DRBM domain-containing protein n=1 Tax=Meloidogyne hapla TaxID=6305 RepID=A0A1I8BAG5_MELHA
MSSLLNEQIELMDVDNNGNNGGTIIKQGSVMSLQQQTNWVGRVQELIMKKRIVCKWNDAYTCENEKSNNIMHNCKLQFDILDASATKLERRLEADSQARNKKMAKQEAFRKIFEILNADYGPFNQINVVNENRKDREKKESVVTEMAGNEENLAVVEDKEQQDLPNNITTVNSTTDKYSLTLSPKDLIELSHIERSQDWDETIDIRMLLSDILNDREVNTPRSERLLRCILEWKNPQVERVFCQATLKFIETAKSQIYDIFQVYLEVWTNHNNKQTILCTFGGEGSDLQRARDDACWQALEYLYIFGGFAPKINKNGEE